MFWIMNFRILPILVSAVFCSICASREIDASVTSTPAGRQILSGHLSNAQIGNPSLGALPETNQLLISVGLPIRNPESLTNLLQQLYDPTSASFHHWLSTAEFTEQFSPSPEDYQAVSNYLVSNGLKVVGTLPTDVAGCQGFCRANPACLQRSFAAVPASQRIQNLFRAGRRAFPFAGCAHSSRERFG